ncbi:MAG: beta-ketoacyl-[acyl-carrier-protein] synthase family protein [Sedimentisphaerales bacterium]|nr:beta-ketoacyl-[acyl-carrier-protein] synthase family protein [Sedimentisphaerales bacterium]
MNRVVITGIGAISPLGKTAADLWDGLCAGRCGIDRIQAFDPSNFPCRIAGEIKDFNIRDYIPKSLRKNTKLMSRDIEISIAAAKEAFENAGIVTKASDNGEINLNPERTAIVFGAGLISCDLVELAPAVAAAITDGRFDMKKYGKDGLELVTPLWLLKYLPNMLPCHVGIIHDIQGPSNTITCAEAAGHLAISEARDIIARGDSDMALTGGAEAKVNPIVMIRQMLLKRTTSEYNDKPAEACRPFDAKASGSVFGEAAGLVVLENMEKAKGRSATIYAEIIGTGESNNINPQYEHLEKDGKAIQIAIEKALSEAGINPSDIDLIIPHGTGIAADDLAESKAIEAALGDAVKDIPVFPTKSMTSNTGAAAGAIDVIAAVCAMRDGKIPAAKNCDSIAQGCNLNIATEPIEKEIKHVLCCSYTYGGQTAAIILKKNDE